jgi:hypothetical protein
MTDVASVLGMDDDTDSAHPFECSCGTRWADDSHIYPAGCDACLDDEGDK